MPVAKKELIYLYCVTKGMPQLKECEGEVYSIYHQGLYAIVSKVPEDEFSEENLKKNLNDMEWLKIRAMVHEKTIEEVMKDGPVVPFKFATLFNTEDNLKSCLEEYAEKFKENLKDTDGKEEWGVKIYCDIERLIRVLSEKNEEILMIDEEIRASSTGKAFLLKKKREELQNKIASRIINIYTQDSLNKLREQSLQTRINRLLTKEVTEREDEMILNAAFSIDKNKVKGFINAVDHLRIKYEKKGFFIDCTGPWPPYNFCDFSKETVQSGT